MKMFQRFQGFLLGLVLAVALPALAYKVTDTNIIFGTNGDVTLNIGGGQIKWDNTLGELQKSNDGGETVENLGATGEIKFRASQAIELSTGNGVGTNGNENLVRRFTDSNAISGSGVFTTNHGNG